MRLEGGLKGRDEALKLVQGQAGEIQKLCGVGLQVSESYTGHRGTSFLGRHSIS
jgi:hypothetical protein